MHLIAWKSEIDYLFSPQLLPSPKLLQDYIKYRSRIPSEYAEPRLLTKKSVAKKWGPHKKYFSDLISACNVFIEQTRNIINNPRWSSKHTLISLIIVMTIIALLVEIFDVQIRHHNKAAIISTRLTGTWALLCCK